MRVRVEGRVGRLARRMLGLLMRMYFLHKYYVDPHNARCVYHLCSMFNFLQCNMYRLLQIVRQISCNTQDYKTTQSSMYFIDDAL